MMELIKSWILGVTAAALISGIASAITPSGKLRRVVGLVCGILTIAVMLGPLRDFDLGAYSSYMTEFKNESGEYGINLENENERLIRAIIEERSAAYILDKAANTGAGNLEATVTTRAGGEGYPYPYSVELRGEVDETQRKKIGMYIESELGIPADRQYWNP